MPKTNVRWLKTSNAAYGIISLIILIGSILSAAWPGLPVNQDYMNMDLVTGFFALLSVLFSVMSFRFIVETNPKTAGVINVFLFGAMAGSVVYLSNNPEYYAGLWILALLTSGLYGWFVWVIFLLANSAYFVLAQNDILASNFGNPYLWLGVTSFASVLGMGIYVAKDLRSAEHKSEKHKKKRKKNKGENSTSIQITTDILINSITDGVAIVTKDGIIDVFNPAAQKITGWEGNEAVSLDHHSVLIFADEKGTIYENERNPISQALTSGKAVQDTNAVLQTRSKKSVEVDVLASPIMDGERVSAVIVIFRDVSKMRSEERQRAEFISTASHEMRTPVAAIEGYLALALNDKVSKIDSAARGYLEKAHASTQHLGKLFQDLLTAAKSEDGRLTNNPTVVEVGQLLDELIDGARFTAEKKGLMMKSDFGEEGQVTKAGTPTVRPVAYVYADPERLREVITNLFDNAVKYTEEGSITIGMHTNEKEVTIDVTDTGAGIPKEDIPHLFQKFYRVDNTATRQIGGTGLGLFISRKIIELYNGRVWVESEVDKGSTFHITLPKLSADRAQELLKQESARGGVAATPQSPQEQPAQPPAATPAPSMSAGSGGGANAPTPGETVQK